MKKILLAILFCLLSIFTFANDWEFGSEGEHIIPLKGSNMSIKKEKITYRGFIFIGLIKVGEDPYVIEYNVRMGDPETEAVLPRIESDLIPLFQSLYNGTLALQELKVTPQSATTVVMVSGGYPEDYEIIIEKAVKKRTWEENYNSLSDFVQKNGRLPMSSEKTPQAIILYRWISVQKNLIKNHRLTPEKEKLFQELIKVKYENTKS